MWYEKISLISYCCSFALLAYTLSRREEFTSWLFGLLIVMALLVGFKVEQLTGAQGSAYSRAIDLGMSAVSTYLLAGSGFALMRKNGYLVKLGFGLGYAGQAYGAISSAPDDHFTVYAALDVTGCLLAGGVFGIALAKKFANPTLAALALGFPLVWGFSDLAYWVHESFPIIGNYACKIAMTGGACGTATMAALLAHRETRRPAAAV